MNVINVHGEKVKIKNGSFAGFRSLFLTFIKI